MPDSSKFSLLEKINSPLDIKSLSNDELKLLSDEVSSYIHSIVSQIGGHYSSPLGVVELTIILLKIYDSPKDKIIWDVGHHAYAHKILTGRKKEFQSLRQKDGISGFLKIDENPEYIKSLRVWISTITIGVLIRLVMNLAFEPLFLLVILAYTLGTSGTIRLIHRQFFS